MLNENTIFLDSNISLAVYFPVPSYFLPLVTVSIHFHVTTLKDRRGLEIVKEISQQCKAAKKCIPQKNSFGLCGKVSNPKLISAFTQIKDEIPNIVIFKVYDSYFIMYMKADSISELISQSKTMKIQYAIFVLFCFR